MSNPEEQKQDQCTHISIDSSSPIKKHNTGSVGSLNKNNKAKKQKVQQEYFDNSGIDVLPGLNQINMSSIFGSENSYL